MTNKHSTDSTIIPRAKSWFAEFKTNIIGSCTDLHYYIQTLNFSLRKTFKLVFSFYLLVAIVQTVRLVTTELPLFERNLNSIASQITTAFPSDTQLVWDGQTLNTLPAQTIEIPFTNDSNETDTPEFWLKIDTSEHAERPNDSLFFINKNTLFADQFDNEVQDFPLDSMLGPDPQTFTQTSLQQDVDELMSAFGEIKTVIPFGAFLVFWFGTFFVRTLMIAIDSILIYFLFQVMQRPLPYKKVLQLSWHVLVPVEILHQITLLLYPNSTVPMISITYWLIMICLLWQFRNLRVIKIAAPEKKP